VSYGPNHYTVRPTRTAVIPIGFADGLRRDIAGRIGIEWGGDCQSHYSALSEGS